jgi:YHS domain-containing protein
VILRALLAFVFFALLARAVWRLIEGVVRGATGAPPRGARVRRPEPPKAVKMAQCPVCGTYVVPGKSISDVSQGRTLYFCSETCRAKYAAA